MKKVYCLVFIALLCANICRADNPPKVLLDGEELTLNEYPITDGSDSTLPLRFILACKLLGFAYMWNSSPFVQYENDAPKNVSFDTRDANSHTSRDLTEDEQNFLDSGCLLNSNTHNSFVNLIEDKVELIITARNISRDEKVYADEQGVALISKPIAKDALTFMINNDNPVDNLSIQQIQGIYTGDITNWKEVGGEDTKITAYIRNRNSGSQEKFETMVMDGLTIYPFPELHTGSLMMAPYHQVIEDKNGIAYTPYYYYSVLVGPSSTKAIGVDGVPMTKDNIINDTYPYVTNVYASVRSDIDKSSVAYKIYEFLTTDEGQNIIDESGYIPLPKAASISNVSKVNADITIRNRKISIISDEPAQRLEITDMQGRTLFHENVISNNISVPSDMRGLYMVSVWFANGEKLAKKVMMY